MQFVSTDAWLDVYFQRSPVQRAADLVSDRTPTPAACRNEFNLQLLDSGVYIAGKFFLNASIEEEDYAHLLGAVKGAMDSLHEDGMI